MGKKKILFIADGIALAHAVRIQQLAGYLDENKYDFYMGISSEFSNFMNMENVTYVPIKSLGVKEYQNRLKDISCKHVYDDEVVSMCIESDEEAINLVHPDIVIGDARVSLGIVCRMHNIPYINIVNAYYSVNTLIKTEVPDISPIRYLPKKLVEKSFNEKFKEVNENFVAGYNCEAVKRGLPELANIKELYTNGDYNLFIDTPSLSPVSELRNNEKYIGPVLSFPRQQKPDWWGSIPIDRPIVYCSIGSTGADDKVKRIVKILEKLNVYVIFVTAGNECIKRFPENFYVCKYITALDAIAISDLVIFNGGSGTLYQALYLGKPVVALATISDQFYASSEVSNLSVGKIFRYREMKEKTVTEVIQNLLTDKGVKQKCSIVKNEITKYDSRILFPAAVEQFIDSI